MYWMRDKSLQLREKKVGRPTCPQARIVQDLARRPKPGTSQVGREGKEYEKAESANRLWREHLLIAKGKIGDFPRRNNLSDRERW